MKNQMCNIQYMYTRTQHACMLVYQNLAQECTAQRRVVYQKSNVHKFKNKI